MCECGGEPAGPYVAAGEVQFCECSLAQKALKVVPHGGTGDQVDVETEDGDVEGWIHCTEVQRQLVVHARASAHSLRGNTVVPPFQQDLQEVQAELWPAQQPLQDPGLEVHGVEL